MFDELSFFNHSFVSATAPGMHSAQVGDVRKIARTFPESALKAVRSGSTR